MDKLVKERILNLVVALCVAVGICGIAVMVLMLLGKIPFSVKYVIVPFCFFMSILLSIYQAVKGKEEGDHK